MVLKNIPGFLTIRWALIFSLIFTALDNLQLVWSASLLSELISIPLAVYLYKKIKHKSMTNNV